MSASVIGLHNWSCDVDEEGHREYPVDWLVQTGGPAYGPTWALAASGLPLPGASLSIGSTTDSWAFYQRKGSAKFLKRESRRDVWIVTTVFSTKPARRCQTDSIGNPLLEPAKWKGGTAKYTVESSVDKDGDPLLNSANQRFTGPIVQTVRTHATISLEMNVAWFDLAFLAGYVEAVNDATFWGLPARTLKCTDFDWTQELYGTCSKYYQVAFGFEINPDTWDLSLLDEGDMVKIAGTTPARFRRAKDEFEENVRVLLDGAGNALEAGDPEVYLPFRVKQEKNFSAVAWPAALA